MSGCTSAIPHLGQPVNVRCGHHVIWHCSESTAELLLSAVQMLAQIEAQAAVEVARKAKRAGQVYKGNGDLEIARRLCQAEARHPLEGGANADLCDYSASFERPRCRWLGWSRFPAARWSRARSTRTTPSTPASMPSSTLACPRTPTQSDWWTARNATSSGEPGFRMVRACPARLRRQANFLFLKGRRPAPRPDGHRVIRHGGGTSTGGLSGTARRWRWSIGSSCLLANRAYETMAFFAVGGIRMEGHPQRRRGTMPTDTNAYAAQTAELIEAISVHSQACP